VPTIVDFVAACDAKAFNGTNVWKLCLDSGKKIFNLLMWTNQKRHDYIFDQTHNLRISQVPHIFFRDMFLINVRIGTLRFINVAVVWRKLKSKQITTKYWTSLIYVIKTLTKQCTSPAQKKHCNIVSCYLHLDFQWYFTLDPASQIIQSLQNLF